MKIGNTKQENFDFVFYYAKTKMNQQNCDFKEGRHYKVR